jgi:hypothetical protein
MARRGLLLSRGDERALRGRGWSVPLVEETSDGGTPDKNKDPVMTSASGPAENCQASARLKGTGVARRGWRAQLAPGIEAKSPSFPEGLTPVLG